MNEPFEGVDVDENSKIKQIMDRLKQIMLEGRTSDGIYSRRLIRDP